MILQIPAADFGAAALGGITRVVNGMPATNLLGLYLFEDGAVDDEVGIAVDSSGNGNHALTRSGWPNAVKTAYGVKTPDSNGMCFVTPIPLNPAGQQLTAFVCGVNHLEGNSSGDYNNWIGQSVTADMDTPGAQHPNDDAVVLNYDGTGIPGHYQLYDNGGTIQGAATTGSAGPATYDQNGVAGIDVDAVAGAVKLHQLGFAMASRSAAGISTFYDGSTDRGFLSFGPWSHGSTRSVNDVIGEAYAVAIYGRSFSETEAQTYMQYLADRVALRGVTFP
jgi:hypothetical protein